MRQLRAASNNFDSANKIGEGGFGSVYKVCICICVCVCIYIYNVNFNIDPSYTKCIQNNLIQGQLLDGTVIAVKQLSSKSRQGNREFVNEIGMISGLQHPNLVKL